MDLVRLLYRTQRLRSRLPLPLPPVVLACASQQGRARQRRPQRTGRLGGGRLPDLSATGVRPRHRRDSSFTAQFRADGPLGPGGVEIRNCGTSGAHATYCQDECGGYEGELPGVDNYKYRYYITGKVGDLNTLPSTPMPDSEELYYPYTIRCYRGCTLSSGISDFKSCADTTTGATDGFTSAHTVVDGPGLDGYTTPLAVQCLDGDSYTDYDFTEAVITPVDTAGDGGTTGETGAVTTESDAAVTRAPRQFAVAGAAALVAAIA